MGEVVGGTFLLFVFGVIFLGIFLVLVFLSSTRGTEDCDT